jgi:hypothetical protein
MDELMAPDDVVTRITEAAADADALAIMRGVPHAMLLAVADLLHIDPYGHHDPWLRKAIVTEART